MNCLRAEDAHPSRRADDFLLHTFAVAHVLEHPAEGTVLVSDGIAFAVFAIFKGADRRFGDMLDRGEIYLDENLLLSIS